MTSKKASPNDRTRSSDPEIVHARVRNLPPPRTSPDVTPLDLPSASLVGELGRLIDQARGAAARSLNSELVWLYWQVGHRLRQDIIGEGRAAQGEQVVADIAAALSADYGRGFSKRNLHHMLRFAEVFTDPEIVTARRSQLGWTHLREIIALDDPLARHFNVEICCLEGWSIRTLQLTELPRTSCSNRSSSRRSPRRAPRWLPRPGASRPAILM